MVTMKGIEKGGESRSVSIQVETGIKINQSFASPIFIMSSLWPSWALATLALRCEHVRVCVEHAKSGVKEAFESLWDSHYQWVTMGEWKTELERVLTGNTDAKRCVILLQTSHRRVNAIMRWLSQLQDTHLNDCTELKVLAFRMTSEKKELGRPAKRRKTWSDHTLKSSIELPHSLVGGVVDNAWVLECSEVLTTEQRRNLTRQTAVRASVQDYLSTTLGGASAKEGQDGASEVVEWKKRNVQVVCKSVFSSTGWVRRLLSLGELFDVYEVGAKAKKMLTAVAADASEGTAALKDVTQQLPVRLLIRCLEELVLIKERQDEKETFAEDVQIESQAEVIRREELRREDRDERNRSDVEKLMAKKDDAETNVLAWNMRALHGLVRKEDYWEELHGKALNGLRSLQMIYYRSYRRGIIGSFRRFMEEKYGKDWVKAKRRSRKHARKKDAEEVEFWRDYNVGLDVISRALNASFWEWDAGSTVCFWRWPGDLR
jgi:hypothetical protein